MDRIDRIEGRVIPAVAPVVNALLNCSERTDYTNIGKPETMMLELACQRDGIDPKRCILFGDKMETDMKWARNAGM